MSIQLLRTRTVIITINTIALAIITLLITPSLFHRRLVHTGIASPRTRTRTRRTFTSSFKVTVTVTIAVTLITTKNMSLFVIQQISEPIRSLTQSTRSITSKQFSISIPSTSFDQRLRRLTISFNSVTKHLTSSRTTHSQLLTSLTRRVHAPLTALRTCVSNVRSTIIPRSTIACRAVHKRIRQLHQLTRSLHSISSTRRRTLNVITRHVSIQRITHAIITSITPECNAGNITIGLARPSNNY